MKQSLITTPKKWYFIGLSILVIFLLGWIVFAFFESDLAKTITDISKNSFFACGGSLSVGFLIDIGNTSRENKIQREAFSQLKNNIMSIYNRIAGVSFILNQCVNLDQENKIVLKNYYNKAFWYSDSKATSVLDLTVISGFKQNIESLISRIMISKSFALLNYQLRNAIETLALEKFYSISSLNEDVIKRAAFMSIKDEIKTLDEIVKILGKNLNITNNFVVLSEKEANKCYLENVKYVKEHKEQLKWVKKHMMLND